MQQHSLLATKPYIPSNRSKLVSRPCLIERLNAGLPRQGSSFVRKLTLVSAPAGFGRTTLVSEWVQALGRAATPPIAIAWLSLDEGDNDPVRFLAYMIAALRTIEADVGRGALSALQSPGVAGATTPPPAEAVLTSLINDAVAIPNRIILILDDYQVIASSPVGDALAFLLQRMSETAEAGGHTTRVIEILRLQALAFEAAGDNPGYGRAGRSPHPRRAGRLYPHLRG